VFGVTLIGAFLPITDFRWPAKQVVGEGLSKLNGQWYSINDITVVQLKAWPFETLEELEDD
jgi:hypothetical protein